MEDLLNVEVTVASKSEETIADAPSSVTVFTRTEIEQMGIRDVYQLLNYVPGFQVNNGVAGNGKANTIHIRGSNNSNPSNRVLFLLNGQRLNASHYGGATIFMSTLATGMIKQVEIIRGPGSALYGSNAFLGVVNIVTRTEGSDVTLKAGNLGYTDASIHYSANTDDLTFNVFVRASSDDGDDLELVDGTVTQDPSEENDLFVSLRYKGFFINALYYESEDEDYIVFGSLPSDRNTSQKEKTSINLGYEWSNDKWGVKATAFYNDHEWYAEGSILPAGIDTGAGPLPDEWIGGPNYHNSDEQFSLDFSYNVDEKSSLVFGGTFRQSGNDNAFSLSNYIDLIPIAPFYTGPEVIRYHLPEGMRAEVIRDVVGIYAQYKRQLTENLVGIAGVRYDDYSDFGDTTNPRGGLIYTTKNDGKWKLLYGEAFRAPDIESLWQDSPITLSNPNLVPETVATLELAYIHKFEKAQLGITV
ncbi:MAG: TonB-dependent receptor, partial [Acidobacteriota bacterium]|nr:TonB-dependent receptor [Acidobacteriota bacterium]